jgi:hypothetical protein
VTNVSTGSDRISFDIGSPSMSDLTVDDIKFRIEEYLTINVPPFELKELKVQKTKGLALKHPVRRAMALKI